MLRRTISWAIQTRSIKNQVKAEWVRPPYVPAYKPERSGDLEGLPPIPTEAIAKEYAECDEMKEASEAVKKIFSVAHLGQKEYHALVIKELIDRVKRHNYDDDTEETKIAKFTGQIRYLQKIMEKTPKNAKVKQAVQELIDKRKKHLKFLRQHDYKKFEWLLEKLNIEYKGFPESYHKLSRRESLRKLTELHCEEVKSNKLAEYRNLLESQQGPFLKEKLAALKFIKSEQTELKLPVTVTDQDIKKVEKQLEEWTIRDEIKQQAKKKKKNLVLDLE
ncbi:small ribosomal subunit protein uS15m [Amyelois transitella]|uniref:small ribosomal subunit protein uS15m n=1 Tax=Amyelois transitella TaxID=680683 RepID=UPI00067C5885|nr:small ribosomal subunit protein uS15m [Amyelois transitella]